MQSRPQASHLRLFTLLAIALAALIVPFAGVLSDLYGVWTVQPEYSHGIMIPVLSAFLVWRQRHELRGLTLTGSWAGLVLIAAGLGLRFLGQLTTMQTLGHYAFLLVLYGLVLGFTGWPVFRRLWMPLLILVFAVPLPSFLNNALSLKLQLWSSAIGVWFIRAAGVSVLLEGNVIDLGSYQLEVAQACSGLRYLFPLMTLAFIVAYVFRGPMWKRITIFLVSIPITVLMNSLRIAAIGITVDRWGARMAEGALHDFEGWLVFMFSTAALVLVALVLTRVGRHRTRWSDAFNLTAAPAAIASAPGEEAVTATARETLRVPRPFAAAAGLAVLGAVVGFATPAPSVSAPQRVAFDEFPVMVGDWRGQREALQSVYLDALRLDDYVMLDYRNADGVPVNFYAAYYQTQDSTREVHSPHDCIPGGGWEIQKLERRTFPPDGTRVGFPMNRAVIQLGSSRQIVYYWFQERGRHLTNEYVVRWYLFWDALTRHRTDGALVRFVAPLPQGATESDIDARMMSLATRIVPTLGRYIPD
jgi:exosortase D (VPLPA-CTERM-specific)